MIPIYLFFLSLGGVLVLTSFFLGGGADADADFDADADADFDADADADLDADPDAGGTGGIEWSVLPFGSLRFWTFLMFVFGGTGLPLELLGVPTWIGAILALVMGIGVGWAAFRFFRWLAKEEVTGAVGLSSYVDQVGRVLLPVRPGGVGKIVLESLSGDVELQATTGDSRPLEVGARALVVGIDGEGRAEVTSLPGSGSLDAVHRARQQRAASERQL